MSSRMASPILPEESSINRRWRSLSSGEMRDRRQARTAMAPIMITRMASSAAVMPSAVVCTFGRLDRDRGFLENLGPVFEKLIETLVGQRVIEQHIQHLERHGGDMG